MHFFLSSLNQIKLDSLQIQIEGNTIRIQINIVIYETVTVIWKFNTQ